MTAVVSAVGGYYLASESQKDAAEEASKAQVQAAEAGTEAITTSTELAIEESRRQFDEIQNLLAPYIAAGDTALTQQLNLIGLGGPEAQQQAIDAIESGVEYQAITEAGEEAIQ